MEGNSPQWLLAHWLSQLLHSLVAAILWRRYSGSNNHQFKWLQNHLHCCFNYSLAFIRCVENISVEQFSSCNSRYLGNSAISSAAAVIAVGLPSSQAHKINLRPGRFHLNFSLFVCVRALRTGTLPRQHLLSQLSTSTTALHFTTCTILHCLPLLYCTALHYLHYYTALLYLHYCTALHYLHNCTALPALLHCSTCTTAPHYSTSCTTTLACWYICTAYATYIHWVRALHALLAALPAILHLYALLYAVVLCTITALLCLHRICYP